VGEANDVTIAAGKEQYASTQLGVLPRGSPSAIEGLEVLGVGAEAANAGAGALVGWGASQRKL